jgi:heme exporter protein D
LTVEVANHTAFIVAAYAAAGAAIGGLIAWVMLDYRAQLGALADLERRGFTRRPAPARAEPADEQAKEQV